MTMEAALVNGHGAQLVYGPWRCRVHPTLLEEREAGIDEQVTLHAIEGLPGGGEKRPCSEESRLTGCRVGDRVDLSGPEWWPAGERAGQIRDEYLPAVLAERASHAGGGRIGLTERRGCGGLRAWWSR